MINPKYLVIKNELKQEIVTGKFHSGERFYSESEIIKKYNVSSITAIRALKELVQDGYIVRYQGIGTFVSRARKEKIVKFSDIEIFSFDSDKTRVLSIKRKNKKQILNTLKLTTDSYYYQIERIREANETPYIYHKSYLPEQYINPNYPEINYYNSIYKRLKLDYNIDLTEEKFVETNEILFPAPNNIRKQLEINEVEPVVFQTKLSSLSENNKPIEYVESYKKWNFYKIQLLSNN
ncbi:GntR family transcriptional regulator [Enterococcus gallinarum]|uniref:GntR family transcriptional regulator n=1 Tax=Enterococcus gallinarum TaxID=1353 RepID=UPI0012AC4CDB|nr:GntR family transcriptional regulator [Enterococcus gallinarum]